MATLNEIRELLNDQKNEIIGTLTAKIDSLEVKLTEQQELINGHTTQLLDHETRLKRLEKDLKAVIEKQAKTIAKLDDQVNRSLRNNIVIRGLPGEEKMEETKSLVAKLFSKLDNGKPNDKTFEMAIERAHRQGDQGDNQDEGKKRDGPRHIVARLYCSEAVKHYEKQARLLRMADPNFHIQVSQQYSDAVTDRRNQAMIKRRELIDAGEINAAFLDYPAKLKVRKDGQKYFKLYQEF